MDRDEPIRRNLVEQAIKFLSNPRVGSGNVDVKIAFLKHKGLNESEITEAMKLSAGPLIGTSMK
jgi:hypothetical protein